MKTKEHKLRYLVTAENDLIEITHYIAIKLKNPNSALSLVNKIEKSIINRLKIPLAFEPYASNKPRKHVYYRIYVGNYTVFYVVIDDIVEIRRVLHSKRNAESMLD